MDLSKQSYIDITFMPVKRFLDYLKWKVALEEDKQKRYAEESNKYG